MIGQVCLDSGGARRSNTPLVRSQRTAIPNGQVAQLVEQRTENPRVGGSIPPLATILSNNLRRFQDSLKKALA